MGHRISLVGLFALAACVFAAAQTPQPATFNSPAVQAHVDAAKTLAGNDLNGRIFHDLCDVTFSTRDAPVTNKIPPATRAFDQLYYVGLNRVGAWALVTSGGPRVIMSAEDWDVLARMQPSVNGVVPPAKDMTAMDGQTLTLGNTILTL